MHQSASRRFEILAEIGDTGCDFVTDDITDKNSPFPVPETAQTPSRA